MIPGFYLVHQVAGSLAPGSRVTSIVESQNFDLRVTPRVLGDRVLVRQDRPKETTSGGLIIPGVADKEWPSTGTVVAVGPKNEDVLAGDRVLFKRRPSSALVQDDRFPDQCDHWKDLVRLYAEDILAVVTDEGNQ